MNKNKKQGQKWLNWKLLPHVISAKSMQLPKGLIQNTRGAILDPGFD